MGAQLAALVAEKPGDADGEPPPWTVQVVAQVEVEDAREVTLDEGPLLQQFADRDRGRAGGYFRWCFVPLVEAGRWVVLAAAVFFDRLEARFGRCAFTYASIAFG